MLANQRATHEDMDYHGIFMGYDGILVYALRCHPTWTFKPYVILAGKQPQNFCQPPLKILDDLHTFLHVVGGSARYSTDSYCFTLYCSAKSLCIYKPFRRHQHTVRILYLI